MKRVLIAAILFLFSGAHGATAHAQDAALTVDLVQSHIGINTGFHGTWLQIFGVMDRPGDVVVIVEGPRRDMNVRRKTKNLGTWVNTSSETFKKVPSFYAYASNRPVEEMAPPDMLDAHEVGTSHLNVRLKTEDMEPDKWRIFREAMIRNMQQRGLFAPHSENVLFLSPGFFRTQIYMPANVPVGEYTVKSLYFHEGELKETRANTLKVEQVGLSADVFRFAHRKRFLYALMCIALALFAGWFSNRVGLKR
jgi:uncharacterized protein (TIGR02186 family)